MNTKKLKFSLEIIFIILLIFIIFIKYANAFHHTDSKEIFVVDAPSSVCLSIPEDNWQPYFKNFSEETKENFLTLLPIEILNFIENGENLHQKTPPEIMDFIAENTENTTLKKIIQEIPPEKWHSLKEKIQINF